MEKPCLHCVLSDAIKAYYEAYGARVHGQVAIDGPEVFTAVAEILGEFVSVEPDDKAQIAIIAEIGASIARFAEANKARGSVPRTAGEVLQ